MGTRSVVWIALGALGVACAAGAFESGPSIVVEPTEATDGSQRISGIVAEAGTREHLPGTLVVLQCDCLEGTRETQTNANGVFVFTDLPTGTYTVQVLHKNDEAVRVIELAEGRHMRLNVSLDPDAEPRVVT